MEVEKTIVNYYQGNWAEIWHKVGDVCCYHREDGPAYRGFKADGSLEYEAWILNDNWHREDGPAEIWYDKKDNVEKCYYWIYGNILNKKEFLRRTSRIGKLIYKKDNPCS